MTLVATRVMRRNGFVKVKGQGAATVCGASHVDTVVDF